MSRPTRRARGRYALASRDGSPVHLEVVRAWCVIYGDGLLTDYGEQIQGRARAEVGLDLYGGAKLGIGALDAHVEALADAHGWTWERLEGGSAKLGEVGSHDGHTTTPDD